MNGVAFGYDAGVVVSYNGALYLSPVAGNTATPGADAKWQQYIQREATQAGYRIKQVMVRGARKLWP